MVFLILFLTLLVFLKVFADDRWRKEEREYWKKLGVKEETIKEFERYY